MTTKVHIPLFQIFSVILFISTASFSQYDDLVFEHLTTEEGLPHLTVNCIEQDYLGFLWFGTQNGLVMYDGYTMKVYRPESGDSNSISQGDIKVIYEDNSHNLWIGTGWDNKGGLNLFNRQNETFTRFMNDPNDSTSINHDYIQCLYEDKSERLWIGTKNGLNLFNKIENNFKHYYFQESEKIYEASVVAICENHLTDELLVSSELKGLWKCNLGKYTLSKIKYNNEAEYLNNLFITSFTQNDDEFLWLGTNMGLAKLNLKTQDFNFYQVIKSKKFVPENVNDFRTILKDRNKNIWIGTNGQGLVRFDQRKEEFKVYKF